MKENLWRVRKLFQFYLRFVFVPGIYEWCLSAAICFVLCVPFYSVFIWFHFWVAVYWILVHREFVRLLKCECSFPPTQIRRKKKPQLFPTSEISKIHLQWNFVKCPLTVISLCLYVVPKKLKLNCYIFFMILQKKKCRNIANINSLPSCKFKKKIKQNDTSHIHSEFFLQILLSEYTCGDRLVLSPLIWVSGVKSLLCFMCVNEQSVLYMLGVFHCF